MLKLIMQEEQDGINFTFQGELDMSTTEMMIESLQKVSEGHRRVSFDFSELLFIDSTGVGHLLFESKKLQERGHKLTFLNMNEDIRLVFEVLGVPSVLGEECFETASI
jgi:anti-sigma B factor antagonist